MEMQFCGKRIGTYEFQEESLLGKGTFALVYEGREIEKSLKVAIKVIPYDVVFRSKHSRDQLIREINTLKSVQSDHLVKFYDAHQTKHNVYIFLEFCDGGTLKRLLDNSPNRRVSEKEARTIFSQLSSAFQALHYQNILHRDVKPENILINRGIYKLADFGLSRKLETDEKAQTFAGTKPYMAPQIIVGKCSYTDKCDIWSLGVVLYEVLYGRLPFKGLFEKELIENITLGNFTFPDEPVVSTELKELIQRMLSVDEKERCDWDTFFKFKWEDEPRGSPSPAPSGRENTSPNWRTNQSTQIFNRFQLEFAGPDILLTESLSNAIKQCRAPGQTERVLLELNEKAMDSFLEVVKTQILSSPGSETPIIGQIIKELDDLCKFIRETDAESRLGHFLTLLWAQLITLIKVFRVPAFTKNQEWEKQAKDRVLQLHFLEDKDLRDIISSNP